MEESWDAGKVFVGGISWETTEAVLRDYFKKYGDVTEAISVMDRATGNPRGFAFVLFSDHDAVERALNDKDPHVILGRAVEVKRARPRIERHQNQMEHENRGQSNSSTSTNSSTTRSHARSKKIFVGGLSSEVTEEVFKAYFAEFGTITDVVVIYDNMTHRSRGFGFIEFESEEAVDIVMKKKVHELNNKCVEVKIAVPKDGYNHRNAGSNSGSNYNTRVGDGWRYGFGPYQGGGFPSHGPRYMYYPAYVPPVVSGYYYGAAGYGGGYAIGADNRVGYGVPFVSSRNPRNDQVVGAARQNPVPYGSASMYPGYFYGGYNYGGYYGMPGNGYNGTVSGNMKWSQRGTDAQPTMAGETITSQVESLKLDA